MLIINLKSFTCFVLLSSCTADSVIQSFSKKLTLFDPADNFLMGHPRQDMEDNAKEIFYSSCKNKEDIDSLICNVTILAWPFDHITYRTICKNYRMSRAYQYPAISWQLTDNKVLFAIDYNNIVGDDSHVRIVLNIIDVENCTNVANISIASESDDATIVFPVVLENTFEIVVKNKSYCKGLSKCKIIYDFKGRMIGEPRNFESTKHIKYYMNFLRNFVPVSSQSSHDGYYLSGFIKNNESCSVRDCYSLVHIDVYGKSKILMTHPKNSKFYTSVKTFAVNNELFSTCAIYDHKTVNCVQYDTQAVKLNVTLELTKDLHRDYICVNAYNLAGGGILILIRYGDTEFWVQRISANGKKFKGFYIDDFGLDTSRCKSYDMVITESKNQFCFTSSKPQQETVVIDRVDVSYYKWCIPVELTLKL